LQATKTRWFVKIKHLGLLLFVLISAQAMAQEESRERMYPIEQIQQGFRTKYVYKRQVIENPLALQIPLLESKDPEVSLAFYRYKSQRKVMTWISSVGLGLSVYSFLKPGKVSDGFNLSTIGAAALVNFYLGTVSMRHLNRALSRYNQLAQTSPQLSLQFTPNTQISGSNLALQWKYNF
jgi:hypothetical protein